MTISTNTRRLAAIVAVCAAFLCFAAVAPAQRPARMSKAEWHALMVRSEALNRKYGLGGSTQKTGSVAPAAVAGSGFAWGDFGIGAATMLGVVLVGIGVLFGSRHGRGSLRAHSSS
jgi:hypothetical protein